MKPAAASALPSIVPKGVDSRRGSAVAVAAATDGTSNITTNLPTSLEESAACHGYMLAAEMLPLPRCLYRSDNLARPKYSSITASEFEDLPEVLDRKADYLIGMLKASRQRCIYSGAGISTASGINDYASNAKASAVAPKSAARLTRSFIESLKPTLAHHTLAAIEGLSRCDAASVSTAAAAKHSSARPAAAVPPPVVPPTDCALSVEYWLQQNHDGLAHKAGFPASKINEIHGSWYDKSNPVVKMSGSLRGDLFQQMLQWEEVVDFVFAIGTSFSGMNADRVATSCADRHLRTPSSGQGLAILTIQKTPQDKKAALRIFSKIDPFMAIVARKLNIRPECTVHPYPAPPQVAPKSSTVAP